MITVKKNEATVALRRIFFQIVDATDGMTPEIGEAGGQPQILVSGVWSDTGIGILVAIGNGRYYAELTQGATNIADRSVIESRYKSANTAEAVGTTVQIIEYPVDASVASLFPSGSRSCVITVKTTDTEVPIPDVGITVLNYAESVVLSVQRTDANGQISITLDDGAYRVRFTKAGYSIDSVTFSVNGNSTITVYGEAFVISLPVPPDACTVWSYLFNPDSTTKPTTVVAKARIKVLPYHYDGKLHSGVEIDGVYNAATGFVYWTLAKGAKVLFTVTNFGKTMGITKTIPAVTSVELYEIED